MDVDGEDSPTMNGKLLESAANRSDFCIVDQRRGRSENPTFEFSYLLDKLIFRLLTATEISFVNFSHLSRNEAPRVVRISDLWNNRPTAILRSRLPIEPTPIDQARRYAGKIPRAFFPRRATPGWATPVSFGMVIILIQIFTVTLSSILMLLNSRVHRQVVPIIDCSINVDSRQVILPSRDAHEMAHAPETLT